MPQFEPSQRRVAYLVNHYPKVSHTFIRREILALERQGITVDRYALRGWQGDLADPADLDEREKTRFTLKQGLFGLLRASLKTARHRPGAFWQALKTSLAMSRKALRPWPYHLIYLGHACQIRLWMEDAPAAHLHAHFGTNSTQIALLVRSLGGPPFSFTIHGMDEVDNAKRLHFPRKVAAAKFTVAISAFTRSQLLRELPPAIWSRVKVVHCGLSDRFFAKDTPALPQDPQFLCIGRLSPEKAHLILLDAFAQVLGDHPQARLVLAGDGDMRAQIETKIADLDIGHAVRITGWIGSDQVRAELEACHTLVQPSFIEGLPVVIMEAMAMRRAVISTFVAGIPELVKPGETGWLVPAGDIETLQTAMGESITTGPDTLRAMGQAGQARARARHDIDTEARKLAALFFGDAS